MSEFELSNINNKVRSYQLTEDFIKIAEQRLEKNKERRDRMIKQCNHELLLNVNFTQLVCIICNSYFIKDTKNISSNVIDVSFLNHINPNILVCEAKKFLVELYEEYENKLSIDEIKVYLLDYLIEFSKYLEKQNLKEMGDDFEEDTYEIMRNYQRKVREKRANKGS